MRDNVAMTAYYNDVTQQEIFRENPNSLQQIRIDVERKGVLLFANHKNLSFLPDFQRPGQMQADINLRQQPLTNENPTSVDFAPYLSQPKVVKQFN